MKILNILGELTKIDYKYLILIGKTIIFFAIIEIIKKIALTLVKRVKNNKDEYNYTHKIKMTVTIINIIMFIIIWSDYLSKFLTIISFISAGFTIALRDIIFNFFSGLYIKIAKPFQLEDRIEINNYKGDVVNINTLNFEVLEVNNEDFIGQSTGVITHVPNSIIFSHPLRNYNKGFKYIWNEIVVNIPLEYDSQKAEAVLYRIVNKNDIIKNIPEKLKRQINNISSDYRIYYNQFNPIIYMKGNNDYVEYTIRYLVHPKKARYVNSSLWKHILKAYRNNEIELYNKDYHIKEDISEEINDKKIKNQELKINDIIKI